MMQTAPAPEAKAPRSNATARLVGLIGSGSLALGCFAPLVSGALGQSVNFFQNGQGDGVFVLVAAVGGLLLSLGGYTRSLWVPGLISIGLTVWAYVQIQERLTEIEQRLSGNPFGGLARVELQWGWLLLVVGSVMLIAAPFVKKRGA